MRVINDRKFGKFQQKETTVNKDILQLSRDGTQSARIVLGEKRKPNIEDIQRAWETISDCFVKPRFKFLLYIYIMLTRETPWTAKQVPTSSRTSLSTTLTTKSQQLFIVLSRVFLLSSKASTVLNCTRGREIKIRRANETRVVRSTNRKWNKVAQNDTRVSRNDNQLSKHDNTIWMKRWFVFQFSSRPFP